MDVDQIKQLLSLVREHELSEFEIEHDGLRLRVRRDAAGHAPAEHRVMATPPAASTAPAGPALVAALVLGVGLGFVALSAGAAWL